MNQTNFAKKKKKSFSSLGENREEDVKEKCFARHNIVVVVIAVIG